MREICKDIILEVAENPDEDDEYEHDLDMIELFLGAHGE